MDIRAFTSGLPNAICRTDLALKPKNHPTSGLVKAWYCKKNCNTTTVPLQICNGIVAVFQNKITIFYSPLYICHFLSLHLVSSSLSLSLSLSLQNILNLRKKSTLTMGTCRRSCCKAFAWRGSWVLIELWRSSGS